MIYFKKPGARVVAPALEYGHDSVLSWPKKLRGEDWFQRELAMRGLSELDI